MDNQIAEVGRKNVWPINILIGIILLFLDQISKIWAIKYLQVKGPVVIIKDWFELHYLENKGAAWGIFNGKITFLILFTMIMVCALLYFLVRIPKSRRYVYLKLSMLCIIIGAIGNLVDRIIYGYVVDFIYFKKINFPIFNVADIYVTVGAVVFCILFLFVYKEDELTFWSIKKS